MSAGMSLFVVNVWRLLLPIYEMYVYYCISEYLNPHYDALHAFTSVFFNGAS